MNATHECGDYEGEAGRLYAQRHSQPSPGEYTWLTRVADEEGDPICELACGHGRLCIPLARLGHTVVGLDRSETLIELAVQQAMREPEPVRDRLKFVRDDLRTFELGQPFRYIFIFFGGFLLLKQPAERVSCLRRAYEHLLPGGLLEIEDPNPGPDSIPRQEMEGLLVEVGLTLERALQTHTLPLEDAAPGEPALLYRIRRSQR